MSGDFGPLTPGVFPSILKATYADLGTQPFELLSRRIHQLLFADTVETALVNEVRRGA